MWPDRGAQPLSAARQHQPATAADEQRRAHCGGQAAQTPAEVAALEAAVPAEAVAGARYPAPMMAHLDSER